MGEKYFHGDPQISFLWPYGVSSQPPGKQQE